MYSETRHFALAKTSTATCFLGLLAPDVKQGQREVDTRHRRSLIFPLTPMETTSQQQTQLLPHSCHLLAARGQFQPHWQLKKRLRSKPKRPVSANGPSTTALRLVAISAELTKLDIVRQRTAQLQLQQSVEDLHEEVDSLKRQYHQHSSVSRSNQSPWSVVAEVFHLIESSFRSPWCMARTKEIMGHKETRRVLASIKRAFAHNAIMGNLVGADALMEQLRYYTQYFGEPQLKLQRIEEVAPGVMAAKAKLSVTVTELTLRHIFPHVVKLRDADHYASEQLSLYDRLLGQRLELPGSMNFYFDKDSHRVVRLETRIDFVPALVRSLKDLKDVSDVLEHALITLECVVCGGLNKLAPV